MWIYTGNKSAKFHVNTLSLSEYIAKSFRGATFFDSHYSLVTRRRRRNDGVLPNPACKPRKPIHLYMSTDVAEGHAWPIVCWSHILAYHTRRDGQTPCCAVKGMGSAVYTINKTGPRTKRCELRGRAGQMHVTADVL